ncbi:MAG: 2Fe-2S iron-sulfur cluster-binding protein [Burkholderiales bacterium]
MRLASVAREWIDRNRRIEFTYEGRRFTAFEGDTITAALWAADERVLARSFKYHRPRGLLSLADHDANVLVQDGGSPNVRADVMRVRDGMTIDAVNTVGGVARDRRRFLGWLAPFLPVGFYYKAFYSKKWFPTWELMFRRYAGLGTVDVQAPRVYTPKRYDFCDVLIVGAGPSGLAAAIAAADAGATVVIVDENERAGGSGLFNLGADASVAIRTAALIERARAHPRLSMRTATTAAGYFADHWIPLVDAARITKMRARAVIVAQGAFEQPAVFRNNDLPGVMLASAAQRLIYRFAVKPCERAVILAANTDGYQASLDLVAQGVLVRAIVDLRPAGEPSELAARVAKQGIDVRLGCGVYEALGARDRLRGVVIAPINANGTLDANRRSVVACDGLLMSVGWAPAAQLLFQAGTRSRYDDAIHQFVPDVLPDGIFACGRVNGVHGYAERLADGERAGREAARFLGYPAAVSDPVPRDAFARSHPYPIFAHPKGKNFVDFDEDLQLRDFFDAAQEGFDNIELLKRFTTVGMGPSQGKHSNMNAIRILARIRGLPIERIGTTTARPFYHPVPIAHLAGRGFQAVRETPLRERHASLGAVWMQAGQWLRPEYYAVAGKARPAAIHEEVGAVRNAVGLIDVGTLGKIEISGPDAAKFLERVYTGRFANLGAGTTRYGLMVDEAGVVIDDGVVARLPNERFYFTTTTSGSATVFRELQRLNTMWGMACGLVNLTGTMAAVNLAGPRSREMLACLTASNVSEAAFPYLGAREIDIAGIAARVLRIGFVGELGYEIHVPADRAIALWDALMNAGRQYGIRAFGVEAQRLLRLEKGHIIISQDTDGLTTPFEIGMTWALRMDKPFFVGQRSLAIQKSLPVRQLLVGFELTGQHATSVAECHLVIHAGEIAGRVTSVSFSPTLGKVIGLAMLRPDLAKGGSTFSIRVTDGSMVEARIVPTPFYDAENARQKFAQAA